MSEYSASSPVFARPDYKTQQLSGCERLQQTVLSVDMYKQPFQFILPDGRSKYRSFVGAVLSIITLLTVLTYFVYKLNVIINFNDFDVQISDFEQYYDTDDVFSHENGLMIAGGFVNYDGKKQRVEDPSIATIKFYQKSFNSTDPTMDGVKFKEIKTRFCELDDFDQDGKNEKSKFYQTADHSVSDIDTYGIGLKCPVNPSELSVQGKYDASAARNLMIIVQKCDPKTSNVTCKSEAFISEWLKYKFILIVSNQRKFIQYQFG